MKKMSENPGSKDRSLEALDFLMNVLKEHEQTLDESIHELATVAEQMGNTDALRTKVESAEQKIDNLQKEITTLIGILSNDPKEASSAATVIHQAPQIQATPVTSQNVPFVILHCKQWEEFQNLSMQAQTLTFNYKEEEKVFQADAIKGNQLIKYTSTLPNLSAILRTWLSIQLKTNERNIIEGNLQT